MSFIILSFREAFTNHSSHPETLDEMEEDDDEPGPPPAMPQIPDRFRNGQ